MQNAQFCNVLQHFGTGIEEAGSSSEKPAYEFYKQSI